MGELEHLRGLVEREGKDMAAEARLAAMNALLSPVQALLEQGGATLTHRPVFILGPPRSGTTVLSQLLAGARLFGVTSNFVARFWRAPAVGMTIARALGLEDEGSQLRSTRGRTDGWGAPNEFGYFWSRWFDLGQPTHVLGPAEIGRFDIAGLRRALASMERAVERPLLCKNSTWFTLNARCMAAAFPQCVLVACDRDPFFVAQSLWLQRLDLYGDPARWWSVRPSDHAEISKLAPLAQVAAQAVSIRKGMQRELDQTPDARIVPVAYERLARDPRGVIEDILQAADLEPAAALAGVPHALENGDALRIEAPLAKELAGLIEQMQG